jgi:predicted metalloprotease with PDZ domain
LLHGTAKVLTWKHLKECTFNSFPRTPKVGLQIEDVEEGDGVKILGVDENTPAEKAGLKKTMYLQNLMEPI